MIRRLRFACWISKATHTHSEYVILIVSPRQQWLRERPSLLCYAYIAFSVLILKEGALLNNTFSLTLRS